MAKKPPKKSDDKLWHITTFRHGQVRRRAVDLKKRKPGMTDEEFEKSTADKKADAREAKKRGLTAREFEGSPADKKKDKGMKLALAKGHGGD